MTITREYFREKATEIAQKCDGSGGHPKWTSEQYEGFHNCVMDDLFAKAEKDHAKWQEEANRRQEAVTIYNEGRLNDAKVFYPQSTAAVSPTSAAND